ncbi:hypothetical protein DIPPA_21707 [Diplonema papillatum]|nr:hypothetical protein DIPPA_21707 [Diplonema papillatum]
MRRSPLALAMGYDQVLRLFCPGKTRPRALLAAENRPDIPTTFDDAMRASGRGLTEADKCDFLNAFAKEHADNPGFPGTAEQYQKLLSAAQQTHPKTTAPLHLLSAGLSNALKLKYGKMAEVIFLQLCRDRQRYGVDPAHAEASRFNYTGLLNEVLTRLSPGGDAPRAARARRLVAEARKAGILPSKTTAILLLSHAGETRCAADVVEMDEAVRGGRIARFPGVEESALYFKTLFRALAAAADQPAGLAALKAVFDEALQTSVRLDAEHYLCAAECCIAGKDAAFGDAVLRGLRGLPADDHQAYHHHQLPPAASGDGVSADIPSLVACCSLRLACACGSPAVDELKASVEAIAGWPVHKCTALLAYHESRASSLDSCAEAVEAALDIYLCHLPPHMREAKLPNVLSVLADAGDVKRLEDLTSAHRLPPSVRRTLHSRVYAQARARAEALLFPLHLVKDTVRHPIAGAPPIYQSAAAPALEVPPIRSFPAAAARAPEHPVPAPATVSQPKSSAGGASSSPSFSSSPSSSPLAATSDRSAAPRFASRSSPAPGGAAAPKVKGTAPTGIYMAAVRVRADGKPLRRPHSGP